MTIVARTTQHSIFAINLLREEYTISIEWQKSIFTLVEGFKIEGVTYADCWTIIPITPCYPITIFYPCYTWIILVFRLYHLRISCLKSDRIRINIPIDTILTKARKNIHLYSLIITSKNTCKAILKWYNRTIKNTIRRKNVITINNRVLAISPHYILTVCRTIFPRK